MPEFNSVTGTIASTASPNSHASAADWIN